MKSVNAFLVVLLAFALFCLPACRPVAPPTAAAEEEAEEEVSDLDRPLEELFEMKCEHDMKLYECEECRYEAGVARAPKDLFDQGLMAMAATERRRLDATVELTGELQYDDRLVSHLSSPSAGIIRKVHVVPGDRVQAGQALVEIDSGEVGDARAESQSARKTLALARAEYQRAQALREEKINSEKELLAARRDYEEAQIRLSAADSRLSRLGAGGGTAGGLVLRSSADGTVLFLHAVPGEVAEPGEVIATVGDNSRLWLWADLYESDLALVAAEQAKKPLAAIVTVKAFADEQFPAAAEFLNPAMDESTRTAKLRLSVPNPAGKLFAGMFAKVGLVIPSETEALAVPAAAIQTDAGRSFVFIHRVGDFYVRRPVTPGRAAGDWVEVVKGLEPGQQVVTKGSFLLKSDVLRSKMGAGCAD